MRAKKSRLIKRHIAKTRRLQKKKRQVRRTTAWFASKDYIFTEKNGFISTLVLKYGIESFNSPQGFLKK